MKECDPAKQLIEVTAYEEWKKCVQTPQSYPLYNATTVRKLVERINLLEQRIVVLQGHDDLSYIYRKLNEQEGE